jgi:predicted DNA-binding transcriptional regulator YafY
MDLKERKIIEKAIVSNTQIVFRYYPNKSDPKGILYTQRIVIPIRIFNRLGNTYLLAYFLNGGSLSGQGEGYRLYFTKGIHDVKAYDTNKPIKLSKKISEFKIFYMILKKQID